ncbi:MAG: hypothetical protein KAV82_14665 [Phycisphaerae bacterium]|nr:hypothetical protein [Phycisphaerae bacterium]
MTNGKQPTAFPLCVFVVDDKAVYADRIKEAIRSESPPGFSVDWDFPDCTDSDPRVALEKVLEHWDKKQQFFLVVLDLHWNFELPSQWSRPKYCGLEFIYENMIRRWKTTQNNEVDPPRPWRHAFIRTKLLGANETDEHNAEIETLCDRNRYCIPPSHRFKLQFSNDEAHLHGLAKKASELATEYITLVKAGQASQFKCECLP